MSNKIKKEPYKTRALRVEEKIWQDFSSYKPRDKSWNLFIQEINDIIKYFKSL